MQLNKGHWVGKVLQGEGGIHGELLSEFLEAAFVANDIDEQLLHYIIYQALWGALLFKVTESMREIVDSMSFSSTIAVNTFAFFGEGGRKGSVKVG